MKVKVLKKFRDKNTREIHEPGKTLFMSKQRFEEICKTAPGLVEEVKEPKKAKAEPEKAAAE